MTDDLKQLSDLIMGIEAPVINIFGNHIPGLGSSSAAVQGASTSGSDTTYSLKQKTAEFIRAMDRHDQNRFVLGKELEGLIMEEQTLSVLNENQSQKFLQLLSKIIDEDK